MAKPVVVGVDGSEQAMRALRWAAEEAARRGDPLRVVHAWVWPLFKVGLGPAPGAPPGSGLQAQAERVLTEAEAEAQRVAPDLEVLTTLVTGDTGSRLVQMSHEAQLLVVGHRGLGGFTGLLLGSVGVAVTAHAACPVVVVRGEHNGTGPVAVGIDVEGHSRHAIDTAFAIAQRMGTGVLAVHSFEIPLRQDGVLSWHDHVLAAEEDARALVEVELASARKEHPDVPVEVVLGDNPPAKQMVLDSERSRLVVVGARGSGGFAGLLLGTTTHALIHHAHCPVLVDR